MSWYSSHNLTSGLPVLVAPTDSPSVTAVLMVKTGSINEDPRQAGVSHFLEHFVFKATKQYQNSQEVMRALDSIGAEHNAATGKEFTYYWVRSAASHLPRAIEFLGEVVFRPTLPADLMPLEKGTIIQEMAMYEDNPMMKISELFDNLVFGKDTPLGRDIIGTKDTVNGLSRNDLVNYRSRQYRADNMVLAVAGGVKAKEVLRQAENFFGQFGHKSHESHGSHVSHDQASRWSSGRLVEFRNTDQVHLALGVKSFPRLDPSRYALALLLTIFGGNASSQLFTEIREKRGLAYYIRSGAASYLSDGMIVIRAGVPTAKAAEVEKLVIDMAMKFKFSKQEFADAKEYIKGQTALDWEESQHIAGHLAEEYLFEQKTRNKKQETKNKKQKTRNNEQRIIIKSFSYLVEQIEAVQPEEVEKLSRDLFDKPEKFFMAAIGPVDKELKYKKVK